MQTLESTPKAAAGFAPRLPGAAGTGLASNAEDLRWQLALRIAASGILGRSQLLSDFLLYIVDRSIKGRSDEITEQQIGVSVFGRSEDYNSNDDNIVRSYARKLRKRIDEYFATEGSCEPLRLEIPRGGYTPIFSTHVAISPDIDVKTRPSGDVEEPEYEPREPTVSEKLEPLPFVIASTAQSIAGHLWDARNSILALLIGIVLGGSLIFLWHSRPVLSQEEAASHSLWEQIFSNNRDTFIVPSDDGLVIIQRLVERPVALTAYVNGSYRTKLKAEPDAAELLKLGARRFTNVVDLDFATHLAQLPEVVPGRMMIRYARDLRIDDLRTGNAILIGSDESNPWLQLFRHQLHFCFRFESDQEKPSGFANLYPRTGENAVYSTSGHEERTFGIIAYLPNLTNTGHVLIVAGLNTAGTQAATGFLLDPSLMMSTLQRAKVANGTLQPFELLVSAGNVATNASTPHVVLERIGLPQSH
jgi:hypothetical protein